MDNKTALKKVFLWDKDSDSNSIQERLRQPKLFTNVVSNSSLQSSSQRNSDIIQDSMQANNREPQIFTSPSTNPLSRSTSQSSSQNSNSMQAKFREPTTCNNDLSGSSQSSSTQANLRQRRQPNNVRNLSSSSSQSSSQSGSVTEITGVLKGIQNLQCSQTGYLSIQEVAAKSNLKAEAAEWFPLGFQSPSTTNSSTDTYVEPVHNTNSSVQSRLLKHKISSDNEIVNYSTSDTIFQNKDGVEDDEYDYSSDMRRIKHIIATLTKDPGQFDNLLEIFLETLMPHLEDITPISIITQTLLDEALTHPNFRYTGAKLCWYIEQASPEFRAELHLRCNKKIEDSPDIQNVSLFIAELYTQLPHLNIYGALLIRSFGKLFEKGGNDDIKCICQALKLTGYSLEHSNSKELDGIFKKLREVKSSVSGTALTLLNSVLTLRSTNWGHTSDVSESENEGDFFEYEDVHHDTVFYNTDGEVLTKEENEFIVAHMNYSEELSDYSDPDDLCDPEAEMDEEIQAAFKEFVKLGNKQ
ncbi:unnamed protein product [Phaedon cochleariae]|uniref:MIF4G domain-containing protein n=1 Tax=Phaedon cochleariae TaxID=80249 RepID=A0A9P0DJ99_PHACE|nr:unnamed protein product [Phaedon cochleariae]